VNRLAALVLAATVVLAGCGSTEAERKPKLTVFAAASLTGAFTEIGAKFDAVHGTQTTFSFGGSSDLGAQINEGAPADVFASADEKNMAKLDGKAGDATVFASNTLQIAVPPGNPARIVSIGDLAKPGVQVVLCAPEIPCGAAAQQIEANAGIDIKPVSEEQSVTDVLGKVGAGEADAGLVYVTDVKAAGDKVDGVAFAGSDDVVNRYPIAAIDPGDALAETFVEFVLSPKGQAVLATYGFGAA
jgi:molybdate transport system substrate-binding protein